MEETLGKRIVANRKRLGLTQDQLAERLGVTAQAVSKWENDQSCPDIATLPRLADLLGVSVDALLGRETQAVYTAEVVTNDDEQENEGVHIQKGNWEFRWDSGRRNALTFAFLVLLAGILTLLSEMYGWGADFWEILWPCIPLVYGISGLLHRFSVMHLVISLFGGYYLIENLGIWSLNITGELIFPIVVVLFGVGLLVDALKKPKKNRFYINHRGGNTKKTESKLREDGEHFDSSLSFGENTHMVTLPRLSSGSAQVSFGELIVDLTECEEIADDCQLDVRCSFGELRLRLPKHCRGVVNPGTAFGSVEYKGHPDPDASATIHIDGSVSFGNMVIEYC